MFPKKKVKRDAFAKHVLSHETTFEEAHKVKKTKKAPNKKKGM